MTLKIIKIIVTFAFLILPQLYWYFLYKEKFIEALKFKDKISAISIYLYSLYVILALLKIIIYE